LLFAVTDSDICNPNEHMKMNLDTNQAKPLPFTVAVTGCLPPVTYRHTHRNIKDSDT